MIRTYAIEPQVASDRMALVLFVEGLGVENGRLLAEFPKSWFRLAVSAAQGITPLRDQKRVEERLKKVRVSGFLKVRTGRPFDGTQSWLQNAVTQADGFDAIIHADDSPAPEPNDRLHPASSLFDDPPFWRVDRRVTFTSTRRALADRLKPLLALEQSVAIMDPFFNPTQTQYLKGLADIIAVMRPNASLVIHASAEVTAGKQHLTTNEWEAGCRAIPSHVPSHVGSLTIARWAGGAGVGRPHERWVITPRGGVELGRGIAIGRQQNTASLMPAQSASELWEAFGQDPYTGRDLELRDVVYLRAP